MSYSLLITTLTKIEEPQIETCNFTKREKSDFLNVTHQEYLYEVREDKRFEPPYFPETDIKSKYYQSNFILNQILKIVNERYKILKILFIDLSETDKLKRIDHEIVTYDAFSYRLLDHTLKKSILYKIKRRYSDYQLA